MSDRVEEIVKAMNDLLAKSKKLAQEHDRLMQDYDTLKKELDKLREGSNRNAKRK